VFNLHGQNSGITEKNRFPLFRLVEWYILLIVLKGVMNHSIFIAGPELRDYDQDFCECKDCLRTWIFIAGPELRDYDL